MEPSRIVTMKVQNNTGKDIHNFSMPIGAFAGSLSISNGSGKTVIGVRLPEEKMIDIKWIEEPGRIRTEALNLPDTSGMLRPDLTVLLLPDSVKVELSQAEY